MIGNNLYFCYCLKKLEIMIGIKYSALRDYFSDVFLRFPTPIIWPILILPHHK